LVPRGPRARGERLLPVLPVLGPVPNGRAGGDSSRCRVRDPARDLSHTEARLERVLHEARGDGRLRLLRPRHRDARADLRHHAFGQGAAAVGGARAAARLRLRSAPAAGRGHRVPGRLHRGAHRDLERHVLDSLRRASGKLLSGGDRGVRRAPAHRSPALQRIRRHLSRVRADRVPAARAHSFQLGRYQLPRSRSQADRGRLSDTRVRGLGRGCVGRDEASLARYRQHRGDLLRHLPLHQVLRLVVGDHAEIPVLPDRRAVGHPAAFRLQASAGRCEDREGGVNWTSKHTFAVGAVLVALTNAVALGGAAWNRSGEESRLRLTQRELVRPYIWYGNRENSGMSLELTWRALGDLTPSDPYLSWNFAATRGAPAWLDRVRIDALRLIHTRDAILTRDT